MEFFLASIMPFVLNLPLNISYLAERFLNRRFSTLPDRFISLYQIVVGHQEALRDVQMETFLFSSAV